MSILRDKIKVGGVEYNVFVSPFIVSNTVEELSTYINNLDIKKIIDGHDFTSMIEWSQEVNKSVGLENCKIKCNALKLTENRPNQYLLSGDFSLEFLSDKTFQAKDIKDIIQVHGIRFSRGYRYWFLFEMPQSFMQLYMFPYYKYN